MAEKRPQTLEDHTRWDPRFHFVLLPVALLNVLWCIWLVIRAPGLETVWCLVLGMAFAMAVFMIRSYSLKVQDRLIRLEERLRMQTLLPQSLQARVGELDERQLVALRFASDGELAVLVEATLAQKLKPADIKKKIKSWRPDYFRV